MIPRNSSGTSSQACQAPEPRENADPEMLAKEIVAKAQVDLLRLLAQAIVRIDRREADGVDDPP